MLTGSTRRGGRDVYDAMDTEEVGTVLKRGPGQRPLAGLTKYLEAGLFSDVVLQCDDGEVKSHKMVLAAISPFLSRVLLEAPFSEDDAVLVLPGVQAADVKTFLKNVFQGKNEEAVIPDCLRHLDFSLAENVSRIQPTIIIIKMEGDGEPVLEYPVRQSKENFVWDHFSSLNGDKASCQLCETEIVSKPGKTAALVRHLELRHPDVYSSHVIEQPFDEVMSLGKKPRKNQSMVWQFFKPDGSEMAVCLECGDKIGRKTGKTTGMIRHLHCMHPTLFTEFMKTREADIARGMDSDDDMFGDRVLRESKGVKAEVQDAELEETDGETDARDEEDDSKVPNVKKRSIIWTFFVLQKGSDISKCKLCQKTITCKKLSTSNMIRHMQRRHWDEYVDFMQSAGQEVKPLAVKLKKLADSKQKTNEKADPNDKSQRTCPNCLKVYSTRKCMLYHQKVVHSGVRPYTCAQCGASFARQASFMHHSHNKTRSFLCSHCGKMFLTKNARARHERSHLGVRPHQCTYCEKRFVTHQQRKNHEMVHTGELMPSTAFH